MSYAKVTSSKFSNLYQRFMVTVGDGLPPIVMYYRENNLVHCYLKFNDICFSTSVDVETAMKYISMFNNPIELIEKYGE